MTTVMEDLVSAGLIPPSTSRNIIDKVTAFIHNAGRGVRTEPVSLDQERPEGTTAYGVSRTIGKKVYIVVRGNLDEEGMLQISAHEKVCPYYIID